MDDLDTGLYTAEVYILSLCLRATQIVLPHTFRLPTTYPFVPKGKEKRDGVEVEKLKVDQYHSPYWSGQGRDRVRMCGESGYCEVPTPVRYRE